MKKISQIMTKNLKTTRPTANLQEVGQLMARSDVGMVPVVSSDGKLAGTVTDRDIVVRSVAEGRSPSESLVAEAMTTGAVTCREDDTMDAAARCMQKNQLRRVLVVDENDRLTGVVSLADLARESDATELSGRTLEHISAVR